LNDKEKGLNDLKLHLEFCIHNGDWAGAARTAAKLAEMEGGSGVAFKPETVEEFLAPLDEVSWFCQDLDMSPGRPVKFVGMGGSGKSIIAQSALITTALGLPMWGHFTTKQGPVAHVDWEMGSQHSHRRYRALCYGHGVKPEDLAPLIRFCPYARPYMNDENFEDELARLIDGCSLAIFDSLRRGTPGENENDSAITSFIDRISRASDKTGCTAILLHHATTKGSKGANGPQGAGRGSSAIHDAGGSEFLITGGTCGKPLHIEHTRAFIGGKIHQPFTLRIDDVDGGFNNGGGMVVRRSLDADSRAAKGSKARLQAEDVPKPVLTERGRHILETAKGMPGCSKSELKNASGGSKDTFNYTFTDLVTLGLITTDVVDLPTGGKKIVVRVL
jgi:hypothetical protein